MKGRRLELVQRVKNYYVGDDCIQIMIPHLGDTISILNSDGITYHSKPNSNYYINKYLQDERKNEFPYSQIPIHYDRIRGKKVEFINQLYDFNKVYIVIADNIIKEHFAIKDNDEALLVTKHILPSQGKSQILNRKQLEDLIKSANDGIFGLDGGIFKASDNKVVNFSLPSDEYILNWYKQKLIKMKENQMLYGADPYASEELKNFFYKSIEKLTIEDIPTNIILFEDMIFISVEENNECKEIKGIKGINATYNGPDKFLLEIYDFPITIYSLEHLKQLEQTSSIKTVEPRFSRFLNKNINQEEVKKAKQLILSKKKY